MKRKIHNNYTNLIATLVAFFITFAMNFFLTPYIIKQIGTEANGYLQLANNFINYIAIITVAINSMAGRFVSIEIFNNNYKKANNYFSSVVIANCFIVAVLIIPCAFLILYLDVFINISESLIRDVKLVFSVIFLSFFISVITSISSVGVFVKNKLYLSSLRSIEEGIIKCILLVIMFAVFPTKLYFVPIATLVAQLYGIIRNIYYTKKFTPQLKIKKRYFKFELIKEVLKSGIWNTVNSLSATLSTGLDLLICNLFIGEYQMGVLAIAKTLPSMISGIVSRIASIFTPTLTKYYAKGDIDSLVSEINKSMKIMCFIITIPLGGLISFSDIFFSLWTPGENSTELQILSILTIAALIVTCSGGVIFNLFIVLNKLKLQSMVSLGGSIYNTIMVFILLSTTKLGVYAIAGVSTSTTIIIYMIFTFPYAARCLKQKWYIFYKSMGLSIICVAQVSAVGFFIRKLLTINNWFELILAGTVTGCIGLVINLFILFSKRQRVNLYRKIFSVFGKRGMLCKK